MRPISVLVTEHYVRTINNLYIYFDFRGLFWLSYMIHMYNIDDVSLFINVANVYLTHSLLMSRLMCLSFWKYVDIELNQIAFPKS